LIRGKSGKIKISKMDGIGKGLGCLLFVAIAGAIATIAFGLYVLKKNIGTQTMESKTIVKPDYRLEANGKKVDTVWIYRFR